MNLQIPFLNGMLHCLSGGRENTEHTLIFIHGSGMSSKIWQKQFANEALNQSFRLLAFDLPGHGESARFETYSVNLFTSALKAVIQHFELRNYSVVGNSLGADIALQCIPELKGCRNLMLVSNHPLSNPPRMDLTLKPEPLFMHYLSGKIDDDSVVQIAKAAFHDEKAIPDFFAADFLNSDGKYRDAIAVEIGSGNYLDELESLKTFKGKTYMIFGNHDPFLSIDYLKAKPYPWIDSKYINVFDNSGHFPMWEEAPRFNQLLQNLG